MILTGKSRASSSRCLYCKHFRDATLVEDESRSEIPKFHCYASGRDVMYFNSCPSFDPNVYIGDQENG